MKIIVGQKNSWFHCIFHRLRILDWTSFSITSILTIIGLIFIHSTTQKGGLDSSQLFYSIFLKKQIFGVASGSIIYFTLCFIDLALLCRWGYLFYFAAIGLLGYTIVGGWIGMGAQRWISLYFFSFQPSEVIKILMPLAFTFHLNKQKIFVSKNIFDSGISAFLIPLATLAITFLLILKQPDLGTALIILISGLIFLWIAQIKRSFFTILFLSILVSAPVGWKTLKPYQKQRILAMAGYGDIKKERYQMEQSKIAIGSGGLMGKGLLKGTQNKLLFLPESRTDFIFSVLCEEWGLLGALFVLSLFSLLFLRIGWIILQHEGFLEQMIGIGLLTPIMLSTVVNTGMVTGILPIVGIPLPLFTYGVTNLWITLASLGILNNISSRRFLST